MILAMTDPVLRSAEPADVPAIAAFQTRAWRQAYTGLVSEEYLERMTTEQRTRRWWSRLVAGKRQIAIAREGEQAAEIAGGREGRRGGGRDGEIVGIVSWSRGAQPDGAPELELNSLYVEARYHGTGLARALTDLALGEAPAHLWVFERNPRARAFYTKLGFRPDGLAKVDEDTGVPEIRMIRLAGTPRR